MLPAAKNLPRSKISPLFRRHNRPEVFTRPRDRLDGSVPGSSTLFVSHSPDALVLQILSDTNAGLHWDGSRPSVLVTRTSSALGVRSMPMFNFQASQLSGLSYERTLHFARC